MVAAAFITALNLSDVPMGWIIAGTIALTGVGVFVGHAAREGLPDAARIRALVGAVALLCVFVAGIGGYIRWWDPAHRSGRAWEFVLDGASETECLNVSGEPGGPPLILDPTANRALAPICGGAAFSFECRGRATDGSTWLRLEGSRYWLPEANLRPRAGSSERRPPSC